MHLLACKELLSPMSGYTAVGRGSSCCGDLISDSGSSGICSTLSIVDRGTGRVVAHVGAYVRHTLNGHAKSICCSIAGFFFRVSSPSGSGYSRGKRILMGNLHGVKIDGRGHGRPVIRLKLFLSSGKVPVSFKVFPNGALSRRALQPTVGRAISALGVSHFVLVTSKNVCSKAGVCRIADTNGKCVISGDLGGSRTARIG